MDDIQIAEGLKLVQKEILAEIHRICEENNIRYYLAYGTLIGAVRHDGFIPWDDDIDIMMPYPDMLRFEKVCKTELDTSRFFYQTPYTDPGYKLTINRLRRKDSILLEERFKDKTYNQGIYVDIYPLFGAAPKGFKRKVQIIQAMFRGLYLLEEPVLNHGPIFKIGSQVLLHLKTKKGRAKTEKKLLNKISKYDYDNAERVVCLDSEIRTMETEYLKEWFGNGTLHKFDELMVMIPDNPDKILTPMYGDYMQLPPEDQRKYHHDYIKIEMPKEFR